MHLSIYQHWVKIERFLYKYFQMQIMGVGWCKLYCDYELTPGGAQEEHSQHQMYKKSSYIIYLHILSYSCFPQHKLKPPYTGSRKANQIEMVRLSSTSLFLLSDFTQLRAGQPPDSGQTNIQPFWATWHHVASCGIMGTQIREEKVQCQQGQQGQQGPNFDEAAARRLHHLYHHQVPVPKAWARVTKHSDCFKSKGHQDWKAAEILCTASCVHRF